MLDNADYVDTANTCESESDNIQVSLTSMGHRPEPFVDITAGGFAAALEDKQVLVIPEQENDDLAPAISEEARNVVRDFAARGGRVVVHGGSTPFASDLLNALFGFATVEDAAANAPWARMSGEADMFFGSGPPILPGNDAMSALAATSLPPGAFNVYGDGTEAVVAQMVYGLGALIFLGYDWFNSIPGIDPFGCEGGQDGGWQRVLDLAVSMLRGRCANAMLGTSMMDSLVGTAAGDRMRGLAKKDVIKGKKGPDCLVGGPDDDKLDGGPDGDKLRAGPGDDRLAGGPDKDKHAAGSGDDRVNAADGVKERVRCGPGDDRARVDDIDKVKGCEKVKRVG